MAEKKSYIYLHYYLWSIALVTKSKTKSWVKDYLINSLKLNAFTWDAAKDGKLKILQVLLG